MPARTPENIGKHAGLRGEIIGLEIWQNRIIRKSKIVYHCFSKIPISFLPKRICIPKWLGGKLITG